MNLLHNYTNGNACISLYSCGTRILEAPDNLKLEYPLNIDIRLSQKCSFGMNPRTNKAICSFCHESATTDGADADLEALYRDVLKDLPKGVEIAVGVNHFNSEVIELFRKCKEQGLVVNITVNQGHTRLNKDVLLYLIENSFIKGLGISYRKGMLGVPTELLEYENTVVHVIAGINTIQEVKDLSLCGVNKVLVLGEKNFGFNLGKVKITTEVHRDFYRGVHELFKLFSVVSFDNLALEQLNVKRFILDWGTMYQHEYSFYINAVEQYYSPSSRSSEKTYYNKEHLSTKDYFKGLFPEFN
jgi:hypothetical protein